MKKHSFSSWNEHSPEAYVSNGFIGFRFPKNAFSGTYGLLAGFTALRQCEGVEAMSVIPTPEITFTYKGHAVTPEIICQNYDFSYGELETEAVLTCGGERITVLYTVFCSRTSPTLLMSELCFNSESAPVILGINIKYRVHDKWKHTISDTVCCHLGEHEYDGKCRIISSDKSTDAGVVFLTSGDYESKNKHEPMESDLVFEITPDVKKLECITSYVPGIMHSEPHNQALRMIKLAVWNGFDSLRTKNREAWRKLWESRIVIDGASEDWQDAVDASYFYLMSSCSAFSPASVAPFALSNPDGYQGHVFWDNESFMFLTPMMCDHDVARSMLDYRFKRVPAAENNARLNGYRGIQFPWQSGATGCEVTVPFAGQAGGAGEQHVNLDVALAFDGFARVSGDDGFIREKVWPVMCGVSEWIASRCEKTERGYEILHVTGIDEESDDVSNDSYTNIMSVKILRSAAEYSERLGFGKRSKWLEIADKMFIPSRPDGVLPQYEGMADRDNQPSTTLMSYFPYGYTSGDDTATIRYYIEHGMENYLRYPMLTGFLGMFPAWIGDRKKSREFYDKANLTFFIEPFYSCIEWSIDDPEDRVHPKQDFNTNFITGRGSLLAGLMLGLTKICPWKGGIDSDISEWLGENIVLPEGWQRITVGKMYIKGKAYRAIAENGAKHTVLEEIK